MCNSELIQRWIRHRDVLRNATRRLVEVVGLSSYPASIKNKLILAGLAASLHDFGTVQMQFFIDGFAAHRLETIEAYPEEFILGVTSRQITHDLSVIERAIDQRRDGVEKRKILEQADVVADVTLTRAIPFLRSKVWPVTYLYKSPVIRLIPYAPVALIGIPYTAMDSVDTQGNRKSDNFDYLAIAHEVGHYIYWHGRYEDCMTQFYHGLYKALEDQFPPNDRSHMPLYAHWLEEIFADVFAAMAGGTVTALSIQEILSDNLPKRMAEDDGEHPLAVLRPYIYTQVLYQMGMADAARNLEQLWHESSAYLRVDKTTNPRIHRYDTKSEKVGEESHRSLAEVKDDLQRIAILISNALSLDATSKDQVWTSGSEPETIRMAFDNKFEGVFLPSNFEQVAWPDYNNQWQHNGSQVNVTADDLATQRDAYTEEIVAFEKWFAIFQAGGWSSGGGDDAYPL